MSAISSVHSTLFVHPRAQVTTYRIVAIRKQKIILIEQDTQVEEIFVTINEKWHCSSYLLCSQRKQAFFCDDDGKRCLDRTACQTGTIWGCWFLSDISSRGTNHGWPRRKTYVFLSLIRIFRTNVVCRFAHDGPSTVTNCADPSINTKNFFIGTKRKTFSSRVSLRKHTRRQRLVIAIIMKESSVIMANSPKSSSVAKTLQPFVCGGAAATCASVVIRMYIFFVLSVEHIHFICI